MTQPPSQPPQGGFGPPQDPGPHGAPGAPGQPPQMPPTPPPASPPGQPGYGYPEQPPTQPAGYGHPQQPGTFGQPQEPGQFGQPQQAGQFGQPQQPGQFGQPQQAGQFGQLQQPGPYSQPYNFPTPQQYPGAPGGGSGGGQNFFKGKPAVIIGAAVAVLLIAGGVVWAVTGKDDEKPVKADHHPTAKPTASAPVNPGDGSGDGRQGGDNPEDFNSSRQPGEAKVLWYKSAPDAPKNGADAPGMWITDQVAGKAAYKQVFGYKIADGKPAWDPITFPQPICAASRQASTDGKIFVAYKESTKDTAKCNQLVQIDLATGQKGWTKTIQEGGGIFDSSLTIELSIAKDTLIVGRSQSGTGYRVSDGKELWTKKEEDGACFPAGFTGGERIILALSCGAGQDSEHERVEEVDPATGHTTWSKDLSKGWQLGRVYSTEPVVLYMTNEDKKQWNISTLKEGSGQTRSQVSVDENFAPECGWAILDRDLQGCVGTAADANTLYLPTDAQSGANEIVAINLNTGKESWRVKAPGDTGLLPLKVEGGNLLAYEKPSFDKGGAIVSIPTSGGHKPKTVLQNPEATAEIENGFFSRAIDYVDGRFYISTTRLNGNDEAQEKLMMAFGN